MNQVSDLQHVERRLANGGHVIALDTGAIISPEAEAMLQALHSRSVGGLRHHLQVLAEKGPEKFMSSFYAGYGHKSIGDCGTVTVFVEGVSMLAAKAIQDWRLYSGQEASTRYIDFAHQPFVNPCKGDLREESGTAILERWREFYLRGLEEMIAHLKERFPRQENEKEVDYSKAIRARAFDVMRGFLPAGAATNLAWHMNLRQFADQLMRLRHHPLAEVRNIAEATEDALREMYPSSFSHKKYEATEAWVADWMKNEYYFVNRNTPYFFNMFVKKINRERLAEFEELLSSRPLKTDLPREIEDLGTVGFEFMLDFGSFRDLQRHRAITQRMPLLTIDNGFGRWYLDELTPNLRAEAAELLVRQKDSLALLDLSKEEEQYFIAMGFNVPNIITGTLPAMVYLVELRATRFVHPTLRHRAIQMAAELSTEYGLKIHLDPEPDRFDVKRGTHDIVMSV